MENKRAHPRVKPRFGSPVRVQLALDGKLMTLKVRDVSVGGIGVWVPDGFVGGGPDPELSLSLELPGIPALLLTGMLRHRTIGLNQEGHYGIQFTRVSPTALAQLERYVQGRLAEGEPG